MMTVIILSGLILFGLILSAYENSEITSLSCRKVSSMLAGETDLGPQVLKLGFLSGFLGCSFDRKQHVAA